MAKNLLKNFDKPDIISKVAYNKDKRKFLPVNEQLRLSNLLRGKLFRHYDEMKDEKNRPSVMKKIDLMMNDLKGQRIKDLYMSRREGKHIVDLLCHAIPPELVYAIDDHVPVNVCMAAGELEEYTDQYTQGMCPLTRSMIGLNNTGMCVFFNVADFAIGNDLCHNIKKSVEIFHETCSDLNLYLLESQKKDGKLSVDFKGLDTWVKSITADKGFNREGLIKYAQIYTEIRNTYKEIRELRKHKNPPINGRNSMWAQQLFMVSEPNQLLSTLKELKAELQEHIAKNIGYNPKGNKKRVMLITPRIMPPFAEIFRVIENVDALVVCEEMCMGITNVAYDIDKLMSILNDEKSTFEDAAKYMLETIDQKECSCSNGYDIDMILQRIKEYNIDGVINFSFKSCPCMEDKTKKITDQLNEKGIPAMNFVSDYFEIYDNAEIYMEKIKNFLKI